MKCNLHEKQTPRAAPLRATCQPHSWSLNTGDLPENIIYHDFDQPHLKDQQICMETLNFFKKTNFLKYQG